MNFISSHTAASSGITISHLPTLSNNTHDKPLNTSFSLLANLYRILQNPLHNLPNYSGIVSKNRSVSFVMIHLYFYISHLRIRKTWAYTASCCNHCVLHMAGAVCTIRIAFSKFSPPLPQISFFCGRVLGYPSSSFFLAIRICSLIYSRTRAVNLSGKESLAFYAKYCLSPTAFLVYNSYSPPVSFAVYLQCSFCLKMPLFSNCKP